jgi:hypothetical protein
LADALARVEDRYSAAAYALDQFSRELESEQSLNDTLLGKALAAQRTLASKSDAQGTAQHRVDLDGCYKFDTSEDDDEEHRIALQAAQAETEIARSALAAVKDEISASADRVSQAASDAAAQLRAATEGDGLTEGDWDAFWNARGRDLSAIGQWVIEWTWENIDTIAAVLSIAALVLAWVPYVNIGLRVLSTIADVVATVKHVRDAMTSGDWSDVLWDAVGFLTLGAGRIVAAGFKSATRSATKALRNSRRNPHRIRARSIKDTLDFKAPSRQARKEMKAAASTPQGQRNRAILQAEMSNQFELARSVVAPGPVTPFSWRDACKAWIGDPLVGLKELHEQRLMKRADFPKKLRESFKSLNPFGGFPGLRRAITLEAGADGLWSIEKGLKSWESADEMIKALDQMLVVTDYADIDEARGNPALTEVTSILGR